MSKKVDVIQALDLRINHDLSYKKIAKIQGTCTQAIFKRIKPLLPDDGTKIYQDNRKDILSHLQLKLLSQVDSRRLKKLSARDAVVSMGILYDKEMIERGQSPSQQPILVVVKGTNAQVQVNTGGPVSAPVSNNGEDII